MTMDDTGYPEKSDEIYRVLKKRVII